MTSLRILLTPLFVYFLFWGNGPGYAWALLIFTTAGITDIYDGKLARRYRVESRTGKILDPLADKILVLSAFISFLTLDLIYLWMVVAIVLRDIIITAVRFLLEYKDMPMATSKQAKSKTALQITSITFILMYLSLKAFHVLWFTNPVEQLNVILVLMIITVLVTVYTGLDYLYGNRKSILALVRSGS
ncbi:MAG: CDP-alcohol phosphatidyltransferase family protein [Candidatus Marinimicrobia bacterium]|nr:CDP-alcohol phosphatidyltransferase family protein [Candidatus Neomarinimicrobiota bacterium]